MTCRLIALPSGSDTNCVVEISRPADGTASSQRSMKARIVSRMATASGEFASASNCSRLSTSGRADGVTAARKARRRGSRRMSDSVLRVMVLFEHRAPLGDEELRPAAPAQ